MNVPTPQFEESIGQKAYITVILRLLMSAPRDSGRTLEYGEIVDRDGSLFVRFMGWQAMLASIQEFVAAQMDEEE